MERSAGSQLTLASWSLGSHRAASCSSRVGCAPTNDSALVVVDYCCYYLYLFHLGAKVGFCWVFAIFYLVIGTKFSTFAQIPNEKYEY